MLHYTSQYGFRESKGSLKREHPLEESKIEDGEENLGDINRGSQNDEVDLHAISAGEMLVDTSGTIANLTRCMEELTCEAEHLRLSHDLVKHILSNSVQMGS